MRRISGIVRSNRRFQLGGLFAGSLLWVGVSLAGSIPTSAAGPFVCGGGSPSSPTVIPAGTYSSIVVTGFCAPAAGTVNVLKGLSIAPGAGLDSMNASSKVTIGGNVDVQSGGEFLLGCGPSFDTPCPEGPTAMSADAIEGNLGADGAALLVMHYDAIGGNVGVSGGGGGITCRNLHGLPIPGYVDFASNAIGHNASITGLETCWSGFSNNTVAGNVSWDGNQTKKHDGNFVGANTIARNVSCSGNSPTPHLSDLVPVANQVSGHTDGQCVGEV